MKKTSGIITEKKSLTHIYDFHKLMNENDIMLVYSGEFSQELNKTLLSFIEGKFKSENIEDNTRRKIFNIMVELLQNISKNKINMDEISTVINAIFMICSSQADYVLISSNMIVNKNIPALKERLEQVNSLDKEGLKLLYKDVRLKSSFTDKGGAGIGIIDIARKSERKLDYSFDKINDEHSVFSLIIRVSKN